MPQPFTFAFPTGILRTCASVSRAPVFPIPHRASRGFTARTSTIFAALSILGRGHSTGGRGGAPQRLPAIQNNAAGIRPALSPCAGKGTEPDAALVDAWLARVGVRIHGLHSPPHRSGELRRRSVGRLHGRRAVAAGLRALVPAGAEAVRHRGDGGLFRRAHDRDARLQALRRPGRRLGRHHRRAHGLRACRQADRHPCKFSRGSP